MSSAAENVLLQYVMPIIGVILAIGVVASPTRTVWRTRKKSDIGDFNPLPTVVAVGNMCVWQGYALVSQDPFLTASSGIALLFAVSNTLILFGKTRQQTRDLLLVLMLIYLSVVLLFCTLTAHGRLPFRTVQLMWGIAANVGSCIYYISPLSTAMKVFRTRNSASIHVGNSVMSVVNAVMWIGYLAGGKRIFLVPTFTYYTAATFNLFCLYLCWRFPRLAPPTQVPAATQPEVAAGEGTAAAEALADVQLTTPAQPATATAARQGVSAPRSRAHQTQQAQLHRLSSGSTPLQAAERGAAGTVEHT